MRAETNSIASTLAFMAVSSTTGGGSRNAAQPSIAGELQEIDIQIPGRASERPQPSEIGLEPLHHHGREDAVL
jgi:hypothetical protein